MEKYSAPALYYGMQILDMVSKEGNIGFNKIQERLDVNATSLNRYITTLLKLEYIEKINGKYFPGVKLALLNNNVNIYDIIKKRAEKYLVKLKEEFSVSSALFAISYDSIYCVSKEVGERGLIMPDIGVKNQTSSITSAWGMIRLALILRGKTEEEVMEYMNENHAESYSKVNKDLFFKALKFAIDNGYSDNKNNTTGNIRMIAFPIYDTYENLVGALGVTSVDSYNNDEKAAKIIERLREYSKEISL